MAGMLKTTVRVGSESYEVRQRLQGSQSPASIGGKIADMITDQAVSRHERHFVHEQMALVKAMKHAGTVEANRLMDFITRNLIGQESPSTTSLSKRDYLRSRGRSTEKIEWTSGLLMHGMKLGAAWKPAFDTGGSIEWKALSRRAATEKGHHRFFVNTGQLRATLRGMRSSYPAALGGVEVTVKGLTRRAMKSLMKHYQYDGRRKIALGTIDVKIFPKARVSLFPGLATGRWDHVDWFAGLEASSLIPGSIRQKLSGPRRGGYPYRFRPMVGPATQFWALHRIPNAMAQAVRNLKAPRTQRTDAS